MVSRPATTGVTAPVEGAAELVAWSVEVDDPGDLLSWLPAGQAFAFLRGHDGLVGWGEAVRLSTAGAVRSGPDLAESVEQLLGAMTVRDDVGLPGSGPVAIASLVFDPAASGSVVVVPKVMLGRRDGRAWLTLVTPPGAVEVPALRRRPTSAALPVRARMGSSIPPPEEWRASVADAVGRLRAGGLDKVVLARALDVDADAPLDPRAVAARLAERFPSCFTYVCDGLVGASPELLVRRTGRQAESLVLAGSVRRGTTAAEDAELEAGLLCSVKDRHEHRLAVESVRDVLATVAHEVEADAEPQALRLANITHLASHAQAWLPSPAPSGLALAAALHPTAAGGGTPRARALEVIRELEAAPRGRYAGPVGWVDGHGDGEFALALRCAQLDGARARLWAGAGVVAESDPDAEVAETAVKLEAALTALLS
ncbi:MAG: menaquinone-specific isochorismate synthase [Frankiaceae bacterium]|nr:menaquinone-specific isochorismate synthase [Frankiaceae bacterium]